MSQQPGGVIHDLGYRHFDGERQGTGTILGALYLTSLRHAFGLGRTGKSKVLPFLMLGFSLVPALVVVAVMVLTPIKELLFPYSSYASTIMVLVAIFAAAQAPVLFSRDLRHGSIVHYLARPLTATSYALVRLAALATAILLFLAAPVLLMWAGALLAELDASEQTWDAVRTWGLLVLLSGMLAGLTAVVSSWSTRRGLAVVVSLGLVVIGHGVAMTLQALAESQGAEGAALWLRLLSPFAVYAGLAHRTFGTVGIGVPDAGVETAIFVVVALAYAALGAALVVWRHRQLARR